MQETFYPFTLTRHELRYEFVSVSIAKHVKKIVTLNLTTSVNTYNLALLDILDNGRLSDMSESNNQDLRKILSTIIKVIEDFTSKYPRSSVAFRGSDQRRQRLYRIVIARELSEILKKFEVHGSIENEMHLFEPNVDYDFYLISRI
ncbi:DUF6934 family protein [Dyadobacter chenhuakuii]|jgi:hypothetical protein|uniref:Uncharacterized protein n=1 Tax=Dyadobacter chenhuakuii TaxID=2909339 RepID=A0A9X1QB08_9BACT|nr:hypothetical protein [Dyadobacter chenhuakuii]MCF2498508.1 hypothetical protein [Dyadobacter chenhuakuii]